MADPSKRRAENVDGPWFVDSTCIDCGTCMWMMPETFRDEGGMSTVYTQPKDERRAGQAAIACPTGSIGGPGKLPAQDFPLPVADGVWHLGFHARSTFGSAPWLVRTDAGHVMVDPPRHNKPLERRLQDMGVVGMVISHRDELGAVDPWPDALGIEWAGHATLPRPPDIPLEGDGGTVFGLDWTHVPGHTLDSVVYRHGTHLFTGDHLCAQRAEPERLHAFRRACWHSWDVQIDSMRRMADWEVTRVWPGHGMPWRGTADDYRREMATLMGWMRGVA